MEMEWEETEKSNNRINGDVERRRKKERKKERKEYTEKRKTRETEKTSLPRMIRVGERGKGA